MQLSTIHFLSLLKNTFNKIVRGSMQNEISAQILGQIALLQSMVSQLPSMESMLRFVCRGLEILPDVKSVQYELENTPCELQHDGYGITDKYLWFVCNIARENMQPSRFISSRSTK